MLTGIIIIALVGLLGVLSHRRSRLEHRIYKHVPLQDWLVVLLLPISLYIGWFFVVKNILFRPTVSHLPFSDIDILAFTILFMVYGFVGNAIHFTGKILWRYLKDYNHSMAYKVNEMFHGKLSHYLVYLNALFLTFLLAILEINHPVQIAVGNFYLYLIAGFGVIFGFAGSKTIFYTNEWFGGYNKPLFIISSVLLLFLTWIGKYFRLSFPYYPIYLFVISMGLSFNSAFILRQLFIFMKLSTRRRLRFLAKMFSANV